MSQDEQRQRKRKPSNIFYLLRLVTFLHSDGMCDVLTKASLQTVEQYDTRWSSIRRMFKTYIEWTMFILTAKDGYQCVFSNYAAGLTSVCKKSIQTGKSILETICTFTRLCFLVLWRISISLAPHLDYQLHCRC